VHARNYGLIHGIGRSGNINDLQPKSAGSSLLRALTTSMIKNLLHSINYSFVSELLLLPFATGMSLTLCFLTLRYEKPQAKYIIWPRIDQKTCLKSIITSGYTPIIIEPLQHGDELVTNIDAIKTQINAVGSDNILCVFSTTSCFAPRSYDNVIDISAICKEHNIFHVVNNAYGLYCTKICDMLNQSNKKGKVDLVVSSTDKNFLVPIGGALIYSANAELVNKVAKNYPGRASISPILDVFVSFLEIGKNKYIELIKERKAKYNVLWSRMENVAKKFNEIPVIGGFNRFLGGVIGIGIGITVCSIICFGIAFLSTYNVSFATDLLSVMKIDDDSVWTLSKVIYNNNFILSLISF
jgi:O-phospho-L-seryl-tRNASec:L-selenocysteinyl-tRNA synthase